MSSYMRDQNESLNEFEDKKSETNVSQNETNLYNKYKDNVANQRFQRSAEGIPAISADDFHLLRECNKESFWMRCLPLSVGACALMLYLAKQRKTRPKVWHILSGTFIGWFVGKLSYRRTCEDRLINSNSRSPFVTAMRRRRGIVREDLQSETVMTSDSMQDSSDPYWAQDSKADEMFGYGAHEFADYREDDPQRNPNEDPNSSVTYDSLRARNRDSLKTGRDSSNTTRPFNA